MTSEHVLTGHAAIELWLEGREAWNRWVDKYPDAQVDFSGVDFSLHSPTGKVFDFGRFNFPSGGVNFNGAKFKNENVNFSHARFHGRVDFSRVEFGKGKVSFAEAKFLKDRANFQSTFGGEAEFRDAEFENERVSFSGAKFGRGFVNFERVKFDCKLVNFLDTDFGETGGGKFGKDVSFNETEFKTSRVVFCGANFVNKSANFKCVKFNANVIDFERTNFGDHVDFTEAKFKGNVYFRSAVFRAGDVIFKEAIWERSCIFDPEQVEHCTKLDFSSISVEGELFFGEFKTSCVIDLRHALLKRPIDIHRVEVNYQVSESRTGNLFFNYQKASNPESSSCYRRLKKLAQDSADHDRALDFFAKEMRSSYGYSLVGWQLYLCLLYDNASDYGRSITKPTNLLAIYILLFSLIYFDISAITTDNRPHDVWDALQLFGSSLLFSVSHAIPIYFGSRAANENILQTLFPCGIPDYVHIFTITQGLICGMFLFLIALALRNLLRS